MAINAMSQFAYVIVNCNCEERTTSNIVPITSLDPYQIAAGAESIGMVSTEATKVLQRAIMRNRVRAGEAEMYYRDRGTTLIAHDDLPERLVPFLHPQHDIHPNDGWKTTAALILNSDVEEDSDTGRVDIKTAAGNIPQRHLPENGELAVSPGLPDGFRILEAGDNWSFRIVFAGAEGIGEANYGDSVEVLAFLHWLESIRTNGNAIDTAPATVNLTTVNVRTYRLEQSDGSFVSFRITQIAHGENVLRYTATWVNTTATPDHAAIQVKLDAAEFAIPVTFPAEKPPQGNPELPYRAAMFAFDEAAASGLDLIENHLRYRGPAPAPFGPLEVIVGQGFSLPYDKLLGNPIKAVPMVYGLNAIHFGPGAEANGQVRLPDPRFWPVVPGGDRVLELHNLDATYSLEALAPGTTGDNVITLLPGEDAIELRFTRRENGAGRVFGKVIRRLYITGGDSSSVHFGLANYWTSGSRRVRPIPKPTGFLQGDNRRNAEAFTAGGAQTWADGDGFADAGINSPDAWGMNKGGNLVATLALNVLTGSAGSLNTPNVRLAQNGNGNYAPGSLYEQRTIGAYAQRTWFLNWRGAVELADVFLPVISYPSASTMSLSTLRIPFYALRCLLTESINLELAA